jgi:hypothetical protein
MWTYELITAINISIRPVSKIDKNIRIYLLNNKMLKKFKYANFDIQENYLRRSHSLSRHKG